MKSVLLCVLFFIYTTVNSSCYDDIQLSNSLKKNYVGIFGGVTLCKVKGINTFHQPGYTIGLVLGTHIYQNFRIEEEFLYQQVNLKPLINHRADGGKFHSYAALVNFMYEYPSTFFVKPYFGFGLGYGGYYSNCKKSPFQKNGFINIETKKLGIAFQPIIGFRFPIFQRIEGGFDYRYFILGKNERDHRIIFGLYFLFN